MLKVKNYLKNQMSDSIIHSREQSLKTEYDRAQVCLRYGRKSIIHIHPGYGFFVYGSGRKFSYFTAVRREERRRGKAGQRILYLGIDYVWNLCERCSAHLPGTDSGHSADSRWLDITTVPEIAADSKKF